LEIAVIQLIFHLESDTRIIVAQHWTQNLKHIFPEMKLSGLVPTMYFRAIYIFPRSFLFGISILLYFVSELQAQPQERRQGQEAAAKE
jgi:hypothetical protein